MFFKKNISVTIHEDTSLLIIMAIHNNRPIARMNCIIDKEERKITIGDITCKKNNKGYGSLMMEKLIEYAKQHKFTYINGWLSEVDYNHIDRLYHFYQKFGFKIIPNRDEIKVADIKLIL